ncbi:MAG: helix-turn-helix transcriptional regulator [Erysipelotrichaceae bacterium]|nr:helix-turn-helix transcriptional regulator [Erysipelotrichaceae bacterium]
MFKYKLKELREKAGLSQQALADKLFVSRSAVAKWENGNGIPSDVNLEAIYELFNVTYDDLFGEEIINEYREVTKSKFNYKKLLVVTIIISSIIIFSIIGLLVIQKIKYQNDYEQHKQIMREAADFNEPVSSFGEVPEVYLDVINKKILDNSSNVFLDSKYIYTVNDTSNNDIVEIAKYDYKFNVIKKFEYFVYNGYNSSIGQIITTSDEGILIVCNRDTYFGEYYQYRGYSKITKYDNNYQFEWEYTFTNGENSISDVYEYNNNFYVFSIYSEFSEDVSASVSDIKIYIFNQSGNIVDEKNVTNDEYGYIDFVLFEDKTFYIYGSYQPIEGNIDNVWEYNMNLELVNSYEIEEFWRTYKSSDGLMIYEDAVIVNSTQIPSSYGIINLCINLETGYLLVLHNYIDYDWEWMEKHPYFNRVLMIYQTVYLYMDLDGNIVWCKSI